MALTRTGARSAWQAWAGLLGSAAAWALHQQVLADLLHFDCRWGGPFATLAMTALVFVLIVISALASWRMRGSSETLGFVAGLSLLGAGLFLLLVGVQTLAGLVLPGCPA